MARRRLFFRVRFPAMNAAELKRRIAIILVIVNNHIGQ
jgi:hypothetical protein